MTEQNKSLKYADETDKSFGLAGMAICLVAWDAEDRLAAINIDAAADEAMQMVPDYYLCTSPRVGAKALWDTALRRFQLTSAMIVANVCCRAMVHGGHYSISGEMDVAMRQLLASEGADLCQLEEDETGQLYMQALTHCSRIFRHPGVSELARRLAQTISEQRKLSAMEVFEILEPINRM